VLDDAETMIYAPRSQPDDPDDERVRVSMMTEGLELRLYFEDLSAEGPVLELRLLPNTEELEPKVLRRLIPTAPLYAQYARAAVRFDREDVRGAIQALRQVGRPGRGLNDKFYRVVAHQYDALIDEEEPHPVKALGEMNHVSISAASRWITEARRRGYVRSGGPDGR
jgi:hypothetical protein